MRTPRLSRTEILEPTETLRLRQLTHYASLWRWYTILVSNGQTQQLNSTIWNGFDWYNFLLCFYKSLHTRWVKHNSDLSTNSLGRKISSETASNDTIGSMCSADLAPVDTEFVSNLIGSLGLGDESNLLSKVEVNFFLAIDTLDLDQTNTVVLVAKTACVTEDGSVNMKAWGSGVWHDSVFEAIGEKGDMEKYSQLQRRAILSGQLLLSKGNLNLRVLLFD